MAAPKEIVDLVERFESNQESYKDAHYNETQARREFIDPFFKALGWDIDNEQGFAEAYKDVIHEDAIKVGATTKAPDYSFRIGGQRKFFLEAKKPFVDIKEDIHPAFQLRRYAWTAKLPLSVLTDFEEFSVYDCHVKPDKADKASSARVFYLNYKDYLTRWDEIAGIFSKSAVLKGSFDKYAADKKSKRGTTEVDAAFLEEIAGWREILARNIALRNPDLSTKDLNYAVQAIVNRIVFLRICEDRGIERYMRLQDLLNGERVYPRLCEIFRQADERYNSGIFHFEPEAGRESPDTLTLNLNIDDKPMKEILKRLYYPDSPYEFSVLPAEILGQVYEQFLGKVIRLTEGHRAVVEDKPEVKKAGGVKYTPFYIVDYIVRKTLGPTLKGKKPLEVVLISVLDPACGSGSFLIVAYQYLLDWHRDWYVQNLVPLLQSGLKPSSPEIRRLLPGVETGKKGRKKEPELPIFQGRGGEWRLTTAERKRILLNSIYGVDIDRQAVEVTKLSLLLKVLEGENDETISKQLKLFQERALPDLSNNIKCGNSLIGWDILNGNPGLMQEEIERINPFDWEKEFPEIFQRGGFSVVIGNPPYLRIQGLQEYYGDQIDYFIKNFQSAVKRFDLYLLFIENGFNLLRENGKLGYICPYKFFNSDFGSGLRKFLIDSNAIESIISFGSNSIFNQVSTYTGIVLLSKTEKERFSYFEFPEMNEPDLKNALARLDKDLFSSYNLKSISSDPWKLVNKEVESIQEKLMDQPFKLKDVFKEILVGVQSGIDNIHILKKMDESHNRIIKLFSEKSNSEVEIEIDLLKPFLMGDNIHRYEPLKNSYYIIYPYKLVNGKTTIINENELKEQYPLGYAYLNTYRKELAEIRARQKTNVKFWYSCHRSRDMNVFEKERLITPYASLGGNMTIAPPGIYHNTKGYSLVPNDSRKEDLRYWLGILNSKILWWYISNNGYVLRGGYFVFTTDYLNPFPIRIIDFSDPNDVVQHDRMVSLVDRMLSLHKQLHEARTPHEQTALQRQIEATDRQIDALVYELYGLTEEEIKIVEGKCV